MTDPTHPAQDRLLELALGELAGPDRDQLTAHLSGCPVCRHDYDELAAAIEQTLAAVPRIAPPAGFERTVLGALHTQRSAGTAPLARWRTVLPVAAAALVGMAAGVGVTLGLSSQGGPGDSVPVAVADYAVGLTTATGERVGEVSRSQHATGPALVVVVTDGPAGNRYTCRLVLTDGTTQDVGAWVLDPRRPNSWVVQAPEQGVRSVQLITESGAVWSSAEL